MSKHKTKKTKKSPSKTSKIHFQSSEKNLTSQAGLIPVVKFLEKLGFKELFDEHVSHQRAENAQYSLADGVFMIITGLIGGAFSLTKCIALWSDSVLRRIAGFRFVPHETTLGRLFKEVSYQASELENLVHALRQRVWHRAGVIEASTIETQTTQWIDVDSTVKTVYGLQEGASKGYNPHKRGALSYHPLLAFSYLQDLGSIEIRFFSKISLFALCLIRKLERLEYIL